MTNSNFTQRLLDAYNNSSDGVALYNEVQGIHHEAMVHNLPIVYPPNLTYHFTLNSLTEYSMGLPDKVDFNGCTFVIKNLLPNERFIFKGTAGNGTTIAVDKADIREGAYISEVSASPKLLIVTDNSKWTIRREGNNAEDFYRKDIMLLEDNVLQNGPIAPYANTISLPQCICVEISKSQKVYKNLKIVRDIDSTAVTIPFFFENEYNICLENISVETHRNPANPIYYDRCFLIRNCAKVLMKGITIKNTYSGVTHFGYGFQLSNVRDCTFERIDACRTIKGVFGNDCVNTFTISDSELTRIDVHCYGRDFTCTNCKFHNSTPSHRINRVSSFYGTLKYVNCYFDKFCPVRIDSEFDANTPFDIVMHDCTMVLDDYKSAIVYIPGTSNTRNYTRPELQNVCFPNIEARNLRLIFENNFSYGFIHITQNNYTGTFDYAKKILIDASIEGASVPSVGNIKTVICHNGSSSIQMTEELWHLITLRQVSGKINPPTNIYGASRYIPDSSEN